MFIHYGPAPVGRNTEVDGFEQIFTAFLRIALPRRFIITFSYFEERIIENYSDNHFGTLSYGDSDQSPIEIFKLRYPYKFLWRHTCIHIVFD